MVQYNDLTATLLLESWLGFGPHHSLREIHRILEEDLETLAKVLCSSYSYCEKLPSFPHIKPTDEHPREQWGQAEQSSWIYFRKRLQWTPNLAEQAAWIEVDMVQQASDMVESR